MEVDYDFCRSAKLTPRDLLTWLDLDDNLDNCDCHWDFFGRNMMISRNGIRISCVKKDFDRWANSEEMFFEVEKTGDRNRFINWVIEQRELGYEA